MPLKPAPASDQEFLALAQERFKLVSEAESETRRESLDDVKFSIGEQWPDDIKNIRIQEGKPCLTMNRFPQTIRLVTNEQRQQRPAIQVNPVGDGADVDTAEIIQGMVRHIEVNSDAEVAYDNGFDQMVRSGFGAWRLITDYLPGDSFNLEIFIKRIKNQFSVFMDPHCREADFSDAKWAFIVEDMPIAEYKDTYPDTEAASREDWATIGNNAPGWATKDTIRIAEYFWVEEETSTLYLMDDGSVVNEVPSGQKARAQREKTERNVKWAKINAVEKIEKDHEWPGPYIPIVVTVGDDIDVDGKRHLAGLVRNAKDPQRQYNYWSSASTEMVALAPKAPFIMAEGQDEGHEQEWGAANVRNFSRLIYKPLTLNGTTIGPPQRNSVEPPIQAMTMMTRQAADDFKATTGIYDASLGQTRSDESGKAVLARQKQGDVATLNFSDNLARSIRFTGRQLVQLIPKVYDTARIQRIIKPDQTVDHVGVYNSKEGGTPQDSDIASMQRVYDLGVGQYDVTVTVGPSYQSKRQEAVAAQMALVQAYPQVFPIIGDILVGNSDWPGAKEMSSRMKKMLPPQLQDDPDGDPEAKLNQAQSQLAQMAQQHQLLAQEVQKLTEMVNTKQVETNGKLAIAKLDQETKIAIAEIQTKAQNMRVRAQLEQDLWNQVHSSAHETALQADAQSNQQDMATQQQAHQQGMQADAQAAQAAQQQAAQQDQQGADSTQ